tara:strand:- start:1195 stop:2238 length:1044 start_codon:yes stop_codon:yes gene_type:complete
MSQSIYCNPRLVIDNNDIPFEFSANIDIKGNNAISRATVKIESDKLNDMNFFGKETCIYLNQGSVDNVPIFRGFIQDVKPTDTSLALEILDPRCLLAGPNTPFVKSIRYAGHTLAQFTYRWIDEVINKEKIRIGLDMLNETSPVQPFYGQDLLNVEAKAYDIIKKGISLNRDDDGDTQYKYEIVMIDDGTKSNIHFMKDKKLDRPAALTLSDRDGIIKRTYKKEPTANYIMVGEVKYQIGNQPNGPRLLKNEYLPDVSAYEDTPAEINDILITQLEVERKWNAKEIRITSNKGHYLNLGDLVFLDVEDSEIRGKHKVTSKKLNIGKGRMTVSLSLNKRPPTYQDLLD